MSMSQSRMVVISGGVFQMGSIEGNSNEKPINEIKLDSFYLDKLVVTNRQYREFTVSNPQWQKDRVGPATADKDYLNIWSGNDYPPELSEYSVVNVSWFASNAYAHWRKLRLPTEAEWEFAAGGIEHTKWSLGDTFDPNIYCFNLTHDPIGFPVGQYSANSYDLYDMSGGVWEWVQDSYEVDYYKRSAKMNPLNLSNNNVKALRGGSGHFDDPNYLRCAVRGSNDPRACHEDYGFRCAADVVE